MTCEDLQLLRGIRNRLLSEMESSKTTRDAGYSLNKSLNDLRWEHEQSCLCWYKQLRSEGKFLAAEIEERLKAEAA